MSEASRVDSVYLFIYFFFLVLVARLVERFLYSHIKRVFRVSTNRFDSFVLVSQPRRVFSLPLFSRSRTFNTVRSFGSALPRVEMSRRGLWTKRRPFPKNTTLNVFPFVLVIEVTRMGVSFDLDNSEFWSTRLTKTGIRNSNTISMMSPISFKRVVRQRVSSPRAKKNHRPYRLYR